MQIPRKSLALGLCLALWASCSYSEPYTYGQTPNAAGTGLRWGMNPLLPQESGLVVNGVIYRYTVNKVVEDDMLVHVQNLDARGNGYVFRETDDWSGLPGSTINKMVSVGDVPIDRWGDGSIEVQGQGSVSSASVVYTYRIDQCFDPQSSPTCPGYEPPVSLPPLTPVDIYDAMNDDAVKGATKETDPEIYKKRDNDTEKVKDGKDGANKKQLEKALTAVDSALGVATATAQNMMLQAMTLSVSMDTYYAASIPGGTYKETVALRDAKLPENRRGLRNGFAQQVLHNRMVDMQYPTGR